MIVSRLDANQVLKEAYDDVAKALRTTGSALAEQQVVQPDGSKLHVTVDESALPTGAATSANQTSANTILGGIQTNTTGIATAANQTSLAAKTAAGLVTVAYDSQEITYVGATANIDQVIYKNLGATVATVTLSYDGQGRLTGVTRS